MASAGRQWRLRYERELEEKIRDVFEEAEADLQKKIAEFNRKFKIKEKIHLRDVAEGRWTQQQYNSWLAGQVFQSDLWNAKKAQIQQVLADANAIAIRMANNERVNLFISNANYQAYLLEHGVGINFGFTLYDSATVSRLVKAQPQILPMWKIDEPKDYVWNDHKVNNAIRQGIIQGERLDQIAKRLATGLATSNMNKMLTFARTGMTQAQNAGRQVRLEEAQTMGIKVHKEWMATFDGRTRWQHADLDGQKRPLNKPFRIGGYEIMYPGDPTAHPSMTYNCRCTLVGDLDDYPSEYERYDNIDGKPVSEMTYRQWEMAKGAQYSKSKVVQFNQVGIGACRTVQEVNDLLNGAGVFRVSNSSKSKADLTGCDLDSARAIASAYEQVFARYPQLIGKLDPPNAQPVGMKRNTYAWCYTRDNGRVEVNPDRFNNWGDLVRSYARDVRSGWHPYGTTAESIIVHELGHAIDGLLVREGIAGGYTASGEYRYASSSMRATVMKRAAKKDPDIHYTIEYSWDRKEGMTRAIKNYVSEYATENTREWFAECFAEYITSANPRTVAREFGLELERLLGRIKQ